MEDDSILEMLEVARVVAIARDGDHFVATEQCDEWFKVELSRDDLRTLAAELVALADSE